jgi:hypothetical protein
VKKKCQRCIYGSGGVLLNTCEDCSERERKAPSESGSEAPTPSGPLAHAAQFRRGLTGKIPSGPAPSELESDLQMALNANIFLEPQHQWIKESFLAALKAGGPPPGFQCPSCWWPTYDRPEPQEPPRGEKGTHEQR